MRRKVIIINIIVAFFSLFLLLVSSSILIYKQNYNSCSDEIKNYLSISSSIFDGNNFEKVSETVTESNKDLRLTIIDLDGNVVLDTIDIKEFDNHLEREELQTQNLGKVFKRYSNTEKKTMLYVATFKDNYYLRIALPFKVITKTLVKYIISCIIIMIIILACCLLLLSVISKHSLMPINNALKKLSSLAKERDNIDKLTIDNIPIIINDLNNELNIKIEKIKDQKEEIRIVLDLLNQGVCLIDKNGKINFINSKALELFKENNDIVGKNFIYLSRDIQLQGKISSAIKNKESEKYILKDDGKIISCIITYIHDTWLLGGLIITFDDITNEENINKTKKDFFQNASHELKSPLTSIIGYQQMITENIIDTPEQMQLYSKKTLKEAIRMNNIITDMLDLSALEQNYVKKSEDISLDLFINEIIDSFDKRLNDKGITVIKNINKMNIIGDKKLIDELIRNIIDNAIKYNIQNGKIFITLKDNTLEIKDTGIGIPEDAKSRVFERFYRVDKGRSKEIGGTGLGLSIVKHICEIYQYKLSLTSLIGSGTTIRIELH